MSYIVVRQKNQHPAKTTHTKETIMNRRREKDWQKDLNCIKKNFEENHEGLEEDFILCDEKDIFERYFDNSVEPSPFFKGATLSFFVCITFWAILIFLIT